MRTPRIVLCTLVLNEIQWIKHLYAQHRHWPGRVGWVFVEAADQEYARVNPAMVNSFGLSTDGTTEYLETLSQQDPYIIHVKRGISRHEDRAQGKCEARNDYLVEIEWKQWNPEFIVVLDADEFYPREMQERINGIVSATTDATGFIFKHRELWRPPSIEHRPLFEKEVVKGFWSIPYCRVWRWTPGLRYRSNHNTPETANGVLLDSKLARFDHDELIGMPYYCHMAFSSSLASRQAKHRYYENRGEAQDRKRRWYCDSRRAFETWIEGDVLPHGAKVIPYDGLIPECFK